MVKQTFARSLRIHMTDLINNVRELDVAKAKLLQHKYKDIVKYGKNVDNLDPNKNKAELLLLPYVMNLTYNYIENKHPLEDKDWKAWCCYLIKELLDDDKLNTKEEIFDHIDKFLEYKKKEYNKYVDDMVMYSSEFSRDYRFLISYINSLF